MDTMRTALAGEACLAPTKPCGGKAINTILLPLQGAHKLRLFIPKHHGRLLRARRASPYGGGSITACHGAPLQPQCYLKIRIAHFTGEACFAFARLIIKMMFSMRYACLKCWCGAWGLFSNSRITFVLLHARCGVFCLLLSWARSNFTQKVCCRKLLCTLFRIQTFSWCVLPLRGMNFVSWDKGQKLIEDRRCRVHE